MKKLFILLAGWWIALFVFLTRLTLRFKHHADPRGPLRKKERYVYAILHSHLLSSFLSCDDAPMAAMVSPAAAGEALIPTCKTGKIIPCRGASTRKGHEHRNKGGRQALQLMAQHVEELTPAFFAVDGPHGPRNHVHWGVADLAIQTNAKIVIAGVFPNWRIPFPWTWDRTQIPLPFATLHIRYAGVIDPRDFPSRVELREHVEHLLCQMEEKYDPEEYRFKGQSRHKRQDGKIRPSTSSMKPGLNENLSASSSPPWNASA